MRLTGLFCGLLAIHYCVSAAVDLGLRLDNVELLLQNVIKNDIAAMKEKLTKIQAENRTSHMECCDKKEPLEMNQTQEEEIKEMFDELTEKTQTVMKAFSAEMESLKIQTNQVSEDLDAFRYAVDDLKDSTSDLRNRTSAQQEIFDQFMKTTNEHLKANKHYIEQTMSALQKWIADYTDDRKHYLAERTKLSEEFIKQRNAIASLTRDIASSKSSTRETESQIEILTEESRCKDGWERQLNSCILYVWDYTLTWGKAQDFCHDRGGALVEPSSIEAMQLLIQGLPVEGKRWWIGASDTREEGVWRWESTQRKIGRVPWNDGEPNNKHGFENCMELIKDSVLNDDSCEEYESAKYHICEIRFLV